MRYRFALACLPLTLWQPLAAETLVATRTILVNEILTEGDLQIGAIEAPGAVQHISAAVGLSAKRTIFQGRPVLSRDLGQPALVERNQTVLLVYRSGALSIETEGRALDRGAAGERVRAMNLSSRTTITGTVDSLGAIQVGN